MKKKKKDNLAWVGPAARFFFGAIVGTFAGIAAWSQLMGQDGAWLCVPAGAILFGTLAAVLGDHFWQNLG